MLEQLQDLLLESGGFAEFLLGVATISASLLGGEEPLLCAITVERDGAPATVASSTEAAQRLDEKQYGFDDGPCLTALRRQEIVLIEDLAAEQRWDRYARAVAAEGIKAVLAVPLRSEPGSGAALNCYAKEKGKFDRTLVNAVARHADLISKTLRLALRLHVPNGAAAHLHAALQSRAIVDAAVSLVMLHNRCSHDNALNLLRVASLNENRRIHEIALDILSGEALPRLPEPIQGQERP